MLAGPRALQRAGDDWYAELRHPNSERFLRWHIAVGDAGQSDLLKYGERFSYVWQDPFTPALNPVMWSTEWFERLRGVVNQEAKLMSYSVSRQVRDALDAAGWQCERFATPGKKRHWLRAMPKKDLFLAGDRSL